MVTFNKDSFTITIHTAASPVEDWKSLHKHLLMIMADVIGEDYVEQPWMVMNLLKELMPDDKTSALMIDKNK